ncbi:hypothetical protein CEXT_303761 [Caerostris extrusa]|uniref:Uncharacterized protein n=1 Tax=Caerostris extrusa TaxID=172846 RepID=A0AAV4XPT6_CAEEX|nr:hypothetical protein CEXT_303761 [Caerostris extrusa]
MVVLTLQPHHHQLQQQQYHHPPPAAATPPPTTVAAQPPATTGPVTRSKTGSLPLRTSPSRPPYPPTATFARLGRGGTLQK